MKAVKQISPRAEQLLSEYSLGHIRAEYREYLVKQAFLVILVLPFTLLALVWAVRSIPSFSLVPNRDGNWSPAINQLENIILSLLWGGSISLIGVLAIVHLVITLWKGEKCIFIYEQGFIYSRRRVEVVARWECVSDIRRLARFARGKANTSDQIRLHSSYAISPSEGKRFNFSDAPGSLIEKAVCDSLLPGMLENYAVGKSLDFNLLSINKQGIYLTLELPGKKETTVLTRQSGRARRSLRVQGTSAESGERFLPWDKLELFWIDESRSTLVISKKGERKHWAILPLHQVSNAALCIALVEHVWHGGGYEVA